MRTPVPPVEENFVTAEIVAEDSVGRSLIHNMGLDPDIYDVDNQPGLDDLIDIYGQGDEPPDDNQGDDELDQDPYDNPQRAWLAESGYDSQEIAPWAPVPTAIGKKWVENSPDAQIDIVFPTVYEEDRTAKLKDLGTANGLGVISHQRMAEQMAKELGFEQYEYADEMVQVQQEEKTIGPTAIGVADDIATGVLGLNVGAGGKITPRKGVNPGPGGGSTGPAGQTINAPAPAMATDRGKLPASSTGHRSELSGDSSRDFRRDQRSKSSATQPN